MISNAIKFSTPGKQIIVCVSYNDDANIGLTFSVTDEGRGIEKSEQQNLFKPYVTLVKGELKSGRGTGAGLAIVKEIVKMHGGSVGYRSVSGEVCGKFLEAGSEFSFNLPFYSDRFDKDLSKRNLSVEDELIYISKSTSMLMPALLSSLVAQLRDVCGSAAAEELITPTEVNVVDSNSTSQPVSPSASLSLSSTEELSMSMKDTKVGSLSLENVVPATKPDGGNSNRIHFFIYTKSSKPLPYR